MSILLQAAAPPSPDFDSSGRVDFADFVLFARVFGSGEGEEKYERRYDLNSDGGILFADFVAFANSFGESFNRAPAFMSVPTYTISVAEGTPAGQPIGEPFPATDADGDTLTYSLWGADAEHFAIDARTGQILTKGTYDLEKKKGYAVIVRASDGKDGRVSVVLGITVTEESE